MASYSKRISSIEKKHQAELETFHTALKKEFEKRLREALAEHCRQADREVLQEVPYLEYVNTTARFGSKGPWDEFSFHVGFGVNANKIPDADW